VALVAGTSLSCIIQHGLSRPIYRQKKGMLKHLRYLDNTILQLNCIIDDAFVDTLFVARAGFSNEY